MSDPNAPWQTQEWPPISGEPHAPRAKLRWLVPVIILGSVALLAALAWGVVSAVGFLQQSLAPQAPSQPLIEGAPASPLAVDPLACDGACFDDSSIDAAAAPDSMFAALGLTESSFPRGTYDPATVESMLRQEHAAWRANAAGPDDCFFVPSSAPYATTFAGESFGDADFVHFLGTYDDADRIDVGDQSVRLFANTEAASAYLVALSAAIDACGVVEMDAGDYVYTATVTGMPALSLPESVAAIGWTREGDPGPRWRAYTADLQRGNMVMRVRLLTDGLVTERQFRNSVERYANQLAIVEPVSPGAAIVAP